MELWQRLEEPAQVLICGASRGIGLAMTAQLLERPEVAVFLQWMRDTFKSA